MEEFASTLHRLFTLRRTSRLLNAYFLTGGGLHLLYTFSDGGIHLLYVLMRSIVQSFFRLLDPQLLCGDRSRLTGSLRYELSWATQGFVALRNAIELPIQLTLVKNGMPIYFTSALPY